MLDTNLIKFIANEITEDIPLNAWREYGLQPVLLGWIRHSIRFINSFLIVTNWSEMLPCVSIYAP